MRSLLDPGRNTKVDKPRNHTPSARHEENIMGLYVTVNDAHFMRVIKGQSHRTKDLGNSGNGQAVLVIRLSQEPVSKRSAVSVSHNEKITANRVGFQAVNRANIGVTEWLNEMERFQDLLHLGLFTLNHSRKNLADDFSQFDPIFDLGGKPGVSHPTRAKEFFKTKVFIFSQKRSGSQFFRRKRSEIVLKRFVVIQ